MKDLFAFVVAAVLGLAAYSFGAPLLKRAFDSMLSDTAAAMSSLVTDAAVDYIRAFYPAVFNATAGGVVEITPAMLQATGKLDPAFVDGNYFGQTHSIMVRRLAGQQLQAAVATCGTERIPDEILFRLAPQAGKHAGLISADEPGTARGAVISWAVPITDFGGGTAACPLGPGALVSLVFFDRGSVLPPYLARIPMPEFGTEPSTMQTDLDMGGNTLGNAAKVKATTVEATTLKLGTQELTEAEAATLKSLHAGTMPRSLTVQGSVRAPAFEYTLP